MAKHSAPAPRRLKRGLSTFFYVAIASAAMIGVAYQTRYHPHQPGPLTALDGPAPHGASNAWPGPATRAPQAPAPDAAPGSPTTPPAADSASTRTGTSPAPAPTPAPRSGAAAPTPAPSPAPGGNYTLAGLTDAQRAIEGCLVANGVDTRSAIADARDIYAQGALLDRCRTDASYVQHVQYCNRAGDCTTYNGAQVNDARQCPPQLQGHIQGARISLTIGLGLPGGGYKPEPSIVDTGSPATYVMADQLPGTAFVRSNVATQVIFPFWKGIGGFGVPAHIYRGPIAVYDHGQWVNIGTFDVEGLEKSPGYGIEDALGVDAFGQAHLTEQGTSWVMNFPCA